MTLPVQGPAGGGQVGAQIAVSVASGVLDIEMCRPEKKNALTVAMYEGLTAALEEADRRPDVRVVLLRGQPDVFTSGNDLQDFLLQPAADDDHPAFRFVRTINATAKPIVASVNGACIGVGATMLLHCDLVYAGQHASRAACQPRLCPEAGSSVLFRAWSGMRGPRRCFCWESPSTRLPRLPADS
jgi:enoyl-CoA hydratase/carnithine racemase